MMRKVLLLIIFIHLSVQGFTQQLPSINNSYLFPVLVNPAFSGSGDSEIFLLHKNQWRKDFGGPSLNGIVGDFKLEEKNVGLGGSVFNHRSGLVEKTKIQGRYSYHLKISENSNLLFGLGAGILSTKVDAGKAIVNREDDPALSSAAGSTISPDLDGGIAYATPDFKIGFAAKQLQGNAFSSESINPNRTYTGFSSYTLRLGDQEKSNVALIPSILASKSDNAPLHYNAFLSFSWQNTLWLGVNYKNDYAAGINAAIQVKQIKFGYSYEFPISSVRSHLSLSHEIFLSYIFKFYQQAELIEKDNVKKEQQAASKAEIDRLRKELAEREENLKLHEQEIYDLIDSLYTKAAQEETSNGDELTRLKKTQEEVNKIKKELQEYKKEKNVEIFRLRRQIEELQRKK